MLLECVFGCMIYEQQEPNFLRVGAPAFYFITTRKVPSDNLPKIPANYLRAFPRLF